MPSRSGPARVLILSSEPMCAALMGLLLESTAYEPVFAASGEAPEAALKRTRPLLIILVDVELDVARSDLFHARAARRGVRVILYGRSASSTAVDALGRDRGVPSFTLPIGRGDLTALLERVTEKTPRKDPGERRASVTPTGDALLFMDRKGRRWYVYDRRSGDRRAESRSDREYRAFINEAGEEWRYGLAPDELTATTAATLERQLANASRVSAVE